MHTGATSQASRTFTLVSGGHAHSCSGALHPCKNTPLYRKLLRESCPACTQFIMLSIKRAKMVGRNGPCRLQSIFHLQVTGRFPHKQRKCCLKELNRNCTLGAVKKIHPPQKWVNLILSHEWGCDGKNVWMYKTEHLCYAA